MTELAPTPLQFVHGRLEPGELWAATVHQARMEEGGLRILAQVAASNELSHNPNPKLQETNVRLFEDPAIQPPLSGTELLQVTYGASDMAIAKRFVRDARLGLIATGGN